MAEKVLSRKEFAELAARDPRAAWDDVKRTTEDFSLRIWKMQLLLRGPASSGNRNKEQPRGVDGLEL